MVLLRQFCGEEMSFELRCRIKKCVSVVEDEECLYVQVHTLSLQVHEAYGKYGNIDFLYVRILCERQRHSLPNL